MYIAFCCSVKLDWGKRQIVLLLQSFLTDAWETSSGNVDVLALHNSTEAEIPRSGQMKFRIAGW
jgi:hypothetical protein